MKAQKEFTVDDLHDAMQAGINYVEGRVMRRLRETIFGGALTHEQDLIEKLFENILKDKRGEPRV